MDSEQFRQVLYSSADLSPEGLTLLLSRFDLSYARRKKIKDYIGKSDRLPLELFRFIHSPKKGCEVLEKESGEKIHIFGVCEFGSWGTDRPERYLVCTKDGIRSTSFCEYNGNILTRFNTG